MVRSKTEVVRCKVCGVEFSRLASKSTSRYRLRTGVRRYGSVTCGVTCSKVYKKDYHKFKKKCVLCGNIFGTDYKSTIYCYNCDQKLQEKNFRFSSRTGEGVLG